MTNDFPDLEATITIDATPAQVWAAVTDVRRMAVWSPQVAKTVILGGQVRLGTRFLNINQQGWKHWPTTAKVVTFEPHTDFAFQIVENHTVWRFTLEPTAERGTRVTQRREAPNGVGVLSRVLIPAALGGIPSFNEGLREGMAQTLEKVKADVES